MNTTPRQTEILGLVRQHGFVTVESLAEHFSVTPQTIRRDINTLCDANLLRRRHGGAALMDAPLNASYDTRRVTNLEAKRRIGALVARLIPNRASVSIGIGTTPEQVALSLAHHEDLTVITNNLNAAMALSASGSNKIIIPGGTLRLPDRDLLGSEVDALFRSYRADFGIYGVGGIDPDGTLLDFDRTEVNAREAIRQACRRSILVADLSKLGRQAPAQGGRLTDADLVVFDDAPPAPLAALLEQATQEVAIAGPMEAGA